MLSNFQSRSSETYICLMNPNNPTNGCDFWKAIKSHKGERFEKWCMKTKTPNEVKMDRQRENGINNAWKTPSCHASPPQTSGDRVRGLDLIVIEMMVWKTCIFENYLSQSLVVWYLMGCHWRNVLQKYLLQTR